MFSNHFRRAGRRATYGCRASAAVVPHSCVICLYYLGWDCLCKQPSFFLHLNLAKVAREYGKFDVALDLFNIALADTAAFHHPESRKVRVLSSIAELQFDECRYEESVETYLYVLRLQQSIKTSVIDQAETMLHLGSALRKCGQYKQAQIVLEEALRLNSARRQREATACGT